MFSVLKRFGGWIIGGILTVLGFTVGIGFTIARSLTHYSTIMAQTFFLGMTITFTVLYVGLMITTVIALFNLYHEIFTYVQNNTEVEIISCIMNLLSCTGTISGINTGLAIFWSALVSIVILHLSRFTLNNMKTINNEVWKLGMLIGQAINGVHK